MMQRALSNPGYRRIGRFRGRWLLGWLAGAAVLVALRVGIVHAEQNEEFVRYGVDDGLPSTTAYGLVQDDAGFIWVSGASGGLARFDGYEFDYTEVMISSGADAVAPDTGVILKDGANRLWVGTWGQGLLMLDGERKLAQRFVHGADEAGLPSDRVQSLHLDSDGTVWVGTTDGLAKVAADGHVQRMSQVPGGADLADPRVWSIAGSGEAALWIGTSDGLHRFDAASGRTSVFRPFDPDTAGPRGNEIRVVFLASNGELWLGTRRGLVRFDPANERFLAFDRDVDGDADSFPPINSIVELPQGDLLLGTREGIRRFRPIWGSFVPFSPARPELAALSSADIRQVMLDRSGVLWAASREAGLFQTSPLRQQFSSMLALTGSLSPAEIRASATAVHRDARGWVWVGNNSGVIGVDSRRGTVLHLLDESGAPVPGAVTAIDSTRDGTLWVATEAGLFRRVPGSNALRNFDAPFRTLGLDSASIRAMHISRSGQLLLGLWGHGALRWDPALRRSEWLLQGFSDLAGDAVFALQEDAAGNVWIGTRYSGLFRVPAKGGPLQRFGTDEGPAGSAMLPSNSVQAMFESKEAEVWVGTEQGLVRLSSDGRSARTFRVADGLPDNKVVGIRQDASGNLWVLTKRGLVRMDREGGSVITFSRPDGLASSELNRGAVDIDADGNLYVGTVEGLSYFNTGRIATNTVAPLVVITGVSIDSRPLPSAEFRQRVVLPVGARSLQFSFAALDFHDVERNRFRYRLLGGDEGWQEALRGHVASFTDLPQGTYAFEVIGSNSHGRWSDTPAQLDLVVLGPWWQHRGAQLGMAVAAVFLVYAGYRRRVVTMERTRIELEEKVAAYAGELRAERDLLLASQQEAQQFKGTLDRTLDGVLVFDAGMLAFTYVNQGAVSLLDIPREQLLGRHLYELELEQSEASFRSMIAPLLASTQAYLTYESMFRRADGSAVATEVFLQYIAPEGEAARFVAILSDITERHRVDQMKSEFVSTVSHELRTPLTSISGSLGLVTSGVLGELPAPARPLLELAHRNSLRLTVLINDLLDMEKIVAGKMEFLLADHPLEPLLRHVVEANEPYAQQYSVRLNLAPVPAVRVRVDASRLVQALTNLLSNACKYSPAGEAVQIDVQWLAPCVRIRVIDRGPGIPEAFQPRLFDKFSQADGSDTRSKGGTGLGLAITKELIERMGGRIGFVSRAGEGATFWVELACAAAQEGDTTGASAADAASSALL